MGCKGVQTIVVILCIFCFTLTMWDVKFEVFIRTTESSKGFTLTMWDVKISTTLGVIVNVIVLP